MMEFGPSFGFGSEEERSDGGDVGRRVIGDVCAFRYTTLQSRPWPDASSKTPKFRECDSQACPGQEDSGSGNRT